MSRPANLNELTSALSAFVDARDWSQFHDPKNLVMALSSEVGELTELLRWVDNKASDAFLQEEDARAAFQDEIGDVGILLLLLCARTGIDLEEAVRLKLRRNAEKYPIARSRGRPEKPER
ncbi:MAG: MazG-like family protein [Gemmatimonadota bacterium]